MVRPMVHSRKHYVQNAVFSTASGAATNIAIANAVAVSAKDLPHEVEEGCHIKAVYLEYWTTSDDAVNGTCVAIFYKIPAGAGDVSTTEIAALDTYDNKKNVFHTFQGITPNNVQFPISIFKGWYKVPKSKQRMGLGDQLRVTIFGQSDGLVSCGFNTYKEYM